MKTPIVLLLLTLGACGGSDEPLDTSGLVGFWNGTGTLTAGSSSSGQADASVGITANGTSLSIGGLCLDFSSLNGTATSSTAFSIPKQSCPLVASSNPSGCQAITLAWSSGHGTLENNVLTVTATGTLSGCNQSFDASLTFNGRK